MFRLVGWLLGLASGNAYPVLSHKV